MGSRLRDMIRAVRACKTAAEERGVIAKESANLRTAFKEEDQDYRHRNVAKLMFIHMLGYPTHFGQMECLKLIASPGFPEKRIGYLGLMLLLDERQEVLMLVTNSLKNDLNHANQFIAGLALCALGNICTAEMARDLAPEVEKLLHNNNSYIRKKAALCSVRIVRKVPDLVENLISSATSLLSDKHHGVLIAGIKLCTELCEANFSALEHFRKQTSSLVRILKNLVISGYAPEYDVGGITDPFLQIRVLRLLRLVGRGDADSSDIMSDILAQVATNTESNKNAGNAILYECVLTIMAIEAIGGLRVLAINILGRFLGNRDNNIRYVALNTLIKVVAVDTQAVQRHRTTIVECVKDSDISIRRRALELVCALVNESNVKTLTKELLEYLKVSDPEFKPDLTTKICYLVQKFFPNKRWYIDQMIKVMVEAGRFVKDDISRALLLLISNAAELQGYTVRSLYNAFQKWDGQESLAQVTVWCIGEYGEMLVHHMNELDGEEPVTVTEADTVDVLELVLKDFRASSTTRAFALTALLKVSSRFPSCTERIKALVLQYKGSLVLELQQRSIEFTSILSKHENIKASLVEKMPVLDEATYIAKKVDAADVAFSTDSKSVPATVLPAVPVANGPTKSKSGTNALMDLLNLNVDEASTPSAPQTRKSAGDVLLDLLGGNSSFTSPLVASPVQGPSGGADALLDLLSIGNATSQTTSSPLSTLEPFPQRNPEAASQKPSNPVPDLLSQNTVSSQKDSYSSFTADFKKSSIPGAGFDLLGDLGIGSASSISTTGPVYPPIVAFQSSGLTVSFEFSKQSTNLPATVIHATYTNTSSNTYTDVIFQAAVPKFMQLQLEPASGNVLPANSSGTVTQVIRVNNSQHGQKSLVMRIRVSYKINGQEVLEQGQVNNFPPGL